MLGRFELRGRVGVYRLLCAVDRAVVDGSPAADSDAADARFWTPSELAVSGAFYRELYDEPDVYRSLDGVHRCASAALADRPT